MDEQTTETITTWAARSATISKIAAALSKAQAEIEGAKKGSVNPHFRSKYADLGAVWDAIRGPFTKNELSVLQEPSAANGKVIVTTTVLHSSGEYFRSSLEIPVSKQDAQGYGSGITYGRRYGLQSVAGIAPEDDDGNAASQGAPTPAALVNKVAEHEKKVREAMAQRQTVTNGNGEPVMPFGKYAGKPMKDVPADYLQWILDNKPAHKALAETELMRREAEVMQSTEADEDDLPAEWNTNV